MCERDCDDCAAVDALQYVVTDLFKMLMDKYEMVLHENWDIQKRDTFITQQLDLRDMIDAIDKKGGDKDE